jgi:hypothetical protein
VQRYVEAVEEPPAPLPSEEIERPAPPVAEVAPPVQRYVEAVEEPLAPLPSEEIERPAPPVAEVAPPEPVPPVPHSLRSQRRVEVEGELVPPAPPAPESPPTVQRRMEPELEPLAPPPPEEIERPAPPVAEAAPPVQRRMEAREEPPAPLSPEEIERPAPPTIKAAPEAPPTAQRHVEARGEPPAPLPPKEIERPAPPVPESVPLEPLPLVQRRVEAREEPPAPLPPAVEVPLPGEIQPPEIEVSPPPAIESRPAEVPTLRPSLDEKLIARAVSRERLPLTERRWPPLVSEPAEESSERSVRSLPSGRPSGGLAPLVQKAILPQAPVRPPYEEAAAGWPPLEWVAAQVPATPSSGTTALPLTPGVDLQRQVAPQLEGASGVGATELVSVARPLPLPPVSRLTAVPQAQRMPLLQEQELTGPGVVQRAGEEESAPGKTPGPEKQTEPDLDDLARKVYPLIKRMIAIERERLFSR